MWIDLLNKKIKNWIVIDVDEEKTIKRTRYLRCQCNCGEYYSFPVLEINKQRIPEFCKKCRVLKKENIILKIKELLENKKSMNDICNILKISKYTLRKNLKKGNIEYDKDFFKKKEPHALKGTPQPAYLRKALDEYFSKNGTPFKGKKHTEETKLKMSKNHADFNGEKNPIKKKLKEDKLFRKYLSDVAKNRWKNMSNEVKKRHSESLSKSMCESEFHKNMSSFKNHKSGHILLKRLGITVFYRSSWELKIFNILDNLSIIKNIESENLTIEYIINGIKHCTRPDILIEFDNNNKCLLEIKPKGLINFKNNFIKVRTYINWCKNNNLSFRLITGKFIKNEQLFIKLLYKIRNQH